MLRYRMLSTLNEPLLMRELVRMKLQCIFFYYYFCAFPGVLHDCALKLSQPIMFLREGGVRII